VYLDRTDQLLDAPSVRILERLGAEQARMIAESRELREELPYLALEDPAPVADLVARENAIDDFVVHREARETVGTTQ
jgi:hypothetical protein